MSLLDDGDHYEDVILHLEEMVEDKWGNKRTQPQEVGVPARARFQVQGQSGTSSRRQEQDNEGFSTEKVYMVRFARSSPKPNGAQCYITWQGEKWGIFGDVNRYNSSRRTRHTTYTIRRS
ncbi:head-to-tail stopper [Mycobacterium phage Roary]|nr:head-to-tail stopper [Mycobacterium phage NearlyHeadless]QHB36908.1 head-to-tail stopper [Mycobacterium phage Roary]